MLYEKFKVKIPNVRVATGLYSHWDSFIKVNTTLKNLITNSRKIKPRDVVLKTKEEVFYVLDKKEGESLISKKIFDWLNRKFKNRERKLGGNGNNMGRTLFKLGLRPLVSYPSRPEKLMKASPNFYVALEKKLKNPKDTIRMKDKEIEHIVFEFEKNRYILSWDPISSKGIFDYDWLELASSRKFVDIVLISYAHLLLPKYKKRTDEIIEYFDNPKRPKIHLEFGLGCKESMLYAIKKFSDCNCCDSWGLNETECIEYFGAKSKNLKDLIEASLKVLEDYEISRVCVHCLEFVFSISRFDIKKEIEALKAACLISSAYTFKKFNLKKARKLEVKLKPKKKKLGKYNFCLIPVPVNPEPKLLTGIGDIFSSVQAVKVLS